MELNPGPLEPEKQSQPTGPISAQNLKLAKTGLVGHLSNFIIHFGHY